MKTLTFLLALAILFASCGKPDKKAQLEKLRKQRDELVIQIKKLEGELKSENSNQSNEKIVHVNLTTLEPKEFFHFIEVQGNLDGEENVGIFPNPAAPGIVRSVFVVAGQKVSAGQILIQLDDALYRQQIKELDIQLNLAIDMFEKQAKLWEQKIGSEMQYLNAKMQKESLESKKKTVLEQISLLAIKSPINGTVEELSVKVGQNVSGAMPNSPPIARVVNFAKAKVTADLAESYASRLKVGDEVIISFPDINKEYKTTVNFISRYINAVNRTFSIEAKFTADDPSLKANMIAFVKIIDYRNPKALTVPINLIQKDDQNDYVFVAETNATGTIAKKQIIKKGKDYDGMVEITEGLKSGDKIISTGYLSVEEGTKITQ